MEFLGQIDPQQVAKMYDIYIAAGFVGLVCVTCVAFMLWFATRKVQRSENEAILSAKQNLERELRMVAAADRREQDAVKREERLAERLTQVEDSYRKEFLGLFREVIQGQSATARAVSEMIDVGERMTLVSEQMRSEMQNLRGLIAQDAQTMQLVAEKLERN